MWVESCSLNGFPLDLSYLLVTDPKFEAATRDGLETIRFRRLVASPPDPRVDNQYCYDRATPIANLHNGVGSTYETTTSHGPRKCDSMEITSAELAKVSAPVKWLNDQMYDALPEATAFLDKNQDIIPYPIGGPCKESLMSADIGQRNTIELMLSSNYATLRSINLDWILMARRPEMHWIQFEQFSRFSRLQFPHLRALQLRNAVTDNTKLAPGICLLHPTTYGLDPDHPAADRMEEKE